MGQLVNIPEARKLAALYLEQAYEQGQFALSPPNVPAAVWKRVAESLRLCYNVDVETRTNSEGRSITRINKGLPKGIIPSTPEALDYRDTHPGWRADQIAWIHRHGR